MDYKTVLNYYYCLTDIYTIADDDDEFKNHLEFLSYTEKKVAETLLRGSRYLEGLQQSLGRFQEMLSRCSRQNYTQTNYTEDEPTDSSERARCLRAMRHDEHVRRAARRAMLETLALQEIAVNNDTENEETVLQENAHILRLAQHLEDLGRLTGFQHIPLPGDVDDSRRGAFQSLEAFVRCVTNSTAADRCRYPPPDKMLYVDTTTDVSTSTLEPDSSSESDVTPTSTSQELLLHSDYDRSAQTATSTTEKTRRRRDTRDNTIQVIESSDKSVEKSVEIVRNNIRNAKRLYGVKHIKRQHLSPLIKLIKKRSTNNPAMEFMNYYIKHKVWQHSNLNDLKEHQQLDVENNLPVKSIRKRSLVKKAIAMHLPILIPVRDVVFKSNKNNLLHKVKSSISDISHKLSGRKIENTLIVRKKKVFRRSVGTSGDI